MKLCNCNGKSGSSGSGRDCSSNQERGNRQKGGSGMSGYDNGYAGGVDYDYDVIPLPSGLPRIGILDAPFYDCSSQSLYFVDLFQENIYRYSENQNRVYYCNVPGYPTPSFFMPIRGQQGRFLMGQDKSVYAVQWDGFSTTCNIVGTVTQAENGTNHHTNSAVAGPRGALYFGYFSQGLCGKSSSVFFI